MVFTQSTHRRLRLVFSARTYVTLVAAGLSDGARFNAVGLAVGAAPNLVDRLRNLSDPEVEHDPSI